jgi:hypothetical protein
MLLITQLTVKSEQTGHYILEDGSAESFKDINCKKSADGVMTLVLDGKVFDIDAYSSMEVNGVTYNSPDAIYDAIVDAYLGN